MSDDWWAKELYLHESNWWMLILILCRIILPSRQQATMQWVWWTSSRSDEYLTLQFVGSWTFPDSDREMHPVALTSVEVMVWWCDGVSWRGVITFPTCNSPSNSAAPIRRTADGRSDITNIIRLPHSLYIHYSAWCLFLGFQMFHKQIHPFRKGVSEDSLPPSAAH